MPGFYLLYSHAEIEPIAEGNKTSEAALSSQPAGWQQISRFVERPQLLRSLMVQGLSFDTVARELESDQSISLTCLATGEAVFSYPPRWRAWEVLEKRLESLFPRPLTDGTRSALPPGGEAETHQRFGGYLGLEFGQLRAMRVGREGCLETSRLSSAQFELLKVFSNSQAQGVTKKTLVDKWENSSGATTTEQDNAIGMAIKTLKNTIQKLGLWIA